MNIEQLINNLKICANARVVPFIQGSPGIGKSDAVKQIAARNRFKLIDIRLSQCDPTDLNGLPKLDGERSTYLPFDTFPLEGEPLPKGYNGWLLFLDEINAAPRSLQAAAYKLVLDRKVGNHNLHPNVVIMCAGNKETDNAVVNPLSTALRSRFINLVVEPDYENWLKWAYNLPEDRAMDFRIQAFISWKGNDGLYNFKPENTSDVYACPRTWEFMNRILKTIGDKANLRDYTELLYGTVGNIAEEFISYADYCTKLPPFKDILDGTAYDSFKNKHFKIDEKFLLCNYVSAHTKEITTAKETANVIKFLDLFGEEFGIPFYAGIYQKNPALMQMPQIPNKVKDLAIWLTK